MTPDQRRLTEQASRSAIADLWRALMPLRSVNTFLQTGAHPDDETSALLARLSYGDGVHVAYTCATRGEGGQNAIGRERMGELGVLRTGEMERAAETLDMALYWLNEDYDGAITDFGFSKSGEETAGRWDRTRLVERLVRVIREVRPDAVAPTFLDVPGQHGHHRAVTQATEEAFYKAADPDAFPEHLTDGLKPWAAAKLYLPAWSGAGTAYDDDEPPPNATVAIDTGQFDPMLGATYVQIGEWSRACHRTQGMGDWVDEGAASVPLHRKACRPDVPEDEADLFTGLPRRLADLADGLPDAVAQPVRRAAAAIDRAFGAFPRQAGVAEALAEALDAVRNGRTALSNIAAMDDGRRDDVAFRLDVKERQIIRALGRAVLVVARLAGPDRPLTLGAENRLTLSVYRGGPVAVAVSAVELITPPGWTVRPEADATGILPPGQPRHGAFAVTVPADAPPSHAYRFGNDPLSANADVYARIVLSLQEVANPVTFPMDVSVANRLTVVPPLSVTMRPAALMRPLDSAEAPVEVQVDAVNHTAEALRATASLEVPPEWRVSPQALEIDLAADGGLANARFAVEPTGRAAAGRIALRPTVRLADGSSHTATVRHIDHPHIRPLAMTRAAGCRLQVVDVTIDRTLHVGYVDSGGDRVADWLGQLGVDVERLDAETLAAGDLSRYDTIVVGILGYGVRPDLRAANERIKAWVESGGNLVTQYHRTWDAWNPKTTPPRRLVIGQPSLRWRVTDEAAAVTVLAPDHPVLTRPNPIGPADWQGWVKERGLYFAADWDPAYRPLVEMADPGEAPLRGSLVTADIGRGRHTHVSLNLFYQLDALVPGAFRLLANLVTPPGRA